MINTKDIEKAKKEIISSKRPIVILAQNDDFNRKILEYGKFDVLLNVQNGPRKTKLKKIDTGLNHILAKIATKNKIAIGFDITQIRNLSKKEKADYLEKIIRNITICRKSKTKIAIKENNPKTIAQLLSWGVSTKQIKEAIYF